LDPAHGDHGVDLISDGLAKDQVELPELVSPKADAGDVLSLSEYLNAEVLAKPAPAL
jgi:hypothetical protein